MAGALAGVAGFLYLKGDHDHAVLIAIFLIGGGLIYALYRFLGGDSDA